uniref:CUB_2 domain-containing protein n=1 Tax=Caenorhabditis japonica TaxID=281687 RepID=A0A8R1I792_CAEJA
MQLFRHFYFYLITTFFVIFLRVSAADLACPNEPISSDTSKGSFPVGGVTTFPANYICGIEFLIPDGWILKFIVQTDANSTTGDEIVISDAVNVLNEFSPGESLYYAPAKKSDVMISTKTNKSHFFFSWEFMNVTNYNRVQQPVGSIIKLNLTSLNYYLFTSDKGPVTFHTANINRQFDFELAGIYVYDGENLKAPYLGTLSQFVNQKELQKSSGKSLTLVNFYGTSSYSYGLANNYNDVAGYSLYNFLLLTSDHGLQGNVDTQDTSAFTFYCVDSQETYLTDISILEHDAGGLLVQFQPMTPSNNMKTLLSYDSGNKNSNRMPQQILTNLFTMIVFKSQVSVHFDSGPQPIWTIPYPGRIGAIIPPSKWNPTVSPAYKTTFSSEITYTYKFNFEDVHIAKPGEKVRVEVGTNGITTGVVEFDHNVSNPGVRVANGTYMTTTFDAESSDSSFLITFEIEDINPTMSSPTTVAHVETSTKSTTRTFSDFSIILATVIFFMC